MENEDSIYSVTDELLSIKEQIEDFNLIHFEKLLVTLSELTRYIKKISNSLELIANN